MRRDALELPGHHENFERVGMPLKFGDFVLGDLA